MTEDVVRRPMTMEEEEEEASRTTIV